MFTTLGDNIHTVAVEGNFDDCQRLVKQSFDRAELVEKIGLNSANSINISRLLAQVCYYFDAYTQLPAEKRKELVVAVPSGNFGNLCAAIIAKVLGLPIKRFIAATNLNDTVPRYLTTGEWSPKDTIATLSNAMDVSRPNNWPRIEYLIETGQLDANDLTGCAVDEEQTQHSMQSLHQLGYIGEPHSGVAYYALQQSLKGNETGLFLGTAHPAKFKSSVEDILNIELPLPKEIAESSVKPDLSHQLSADFDALQEFLYKTLL
jgi:threonine synthase